MTEKDTRCLFPFPVRGGHRRSFTFNNFRVFYREPEAKRHRVRQKDIGCHFPFHLFLIEENGEHRLETATIREPAYWTWAALEDMFAQVGFARLDTRQFPGMGRGGTTLSLNVAAR